MAVELIGHPEPVCRLFDLLYSRLGPQGWWPARSPFEVAVGAILTQSVSWSNVERAIANLDGAGLLNPEALRRVPLAVLAELIRPAGYYNAKAAKLKAFVEFLFAVHGGRLESLFAQPLEVARAQLLGVYGIGPETADSILLYAGGMPTFVVDAYTRRIFHRVGICDIASYDGLRLYCMERLPADPAVYNEFHALLVAVGKDHCRKQRPRCPSCPAHEMCRSALTLCRRPG